MATPGELVETMADVLGLPMATVTQYDRQLAEQGLRSRGGRGTSAARVTARDAANLLISVVASPVVGPSVKSAANTCRTYGALMERTRAAQRKNFRRFGLVSLGRLPNGHNLAEALTTLIGRAGEGEILRVPVRGGKPQLADHALNVQFDGPEPWAQILVDDSLGQGAASEMARFVYTPGGDRDERFAIPRGDLHQRRFITFSTIWALGDLCTSSKKREGETQTAGSP